ncbi:ABC transporter permease [Nocardioides sp. zg-1228]|uniref:ABC transporter permease n=1 Tax=Nocardioides sp. zg-1228 TaxID=2763008 RepID=UPI001642ED7E|nr:ABC transporter permease [Nocardioides sp. zg-1228]MBC2932044.1 ABC transporter permease [Nocardioides sp. zg-1228]QSF57595.1 ABC transporter permease [Nocardioides sp. zg-1228]
MLRLTWRNLVARKVRLVMSTLAIVLGIGFLAGVLTFSHGLGATFDNIIEGSTSDAVVRTEGEVSFQASGAGTTSLIKPKAVDRLAALPEVAAADGSVDGVGAYLLGEDGKLVGGTGAPTLVFNHNDGVNIAGEPILVLESGEWPDAPGQINLDASSAERGGYELGDQVTLLLPTGQLRKEFELVGTSNFNGGGTAGATLALLETSEAQDVFLDGEDAYTTVALTAADGASQTELADAAKTVLPDGFTAVTGQEVIDESDEQIGQFLDVIGYFLVAFAVIAIVVGAFIIFNTFSILVSQRVRESALLRALGASRRQVTRSVLVEAFLMGVLGSTLGLLIGLGLSRGLAAIFRSQGLDIASEVLVLTPSTVIAAYVVGIVVTMVAAFVPARRAAKVPPVAALRDDLTVQEKALGRRRLVLGTLALVVGGALMVAGLVGAPGADPGWIGAGAVIWVITVAVMAPVLGHPVLLACRTLFDKLFGTTGKLAGENALRNPRRTGATASALMIGLAVVSAVGVLASSLSATNDELVDREFRSDFLVQSPSFQGFPTQVGDEMAEVDGVGTVSRMQGSVALVDQDQSFVAGVDDAFGDIYDLDMRAGTQDMSGDQTILSASTASDLGADVGSTIPASFPGGRTVALEVVGIFEDTPITNGVTMPIGVLEDAGLRRNDSTLSINVTDGADVDAVHDALDEVVADLPIVTVQDKEGFSELIKQQVNQLLFMIYGLLALAVVIAVIGIVNTLGLSVIERTREVGLLRAVGLSRRRLRLMITLESITIAVLGAVLGLVVGLLIGVALRQSLSEDLTVLALPLGSLAVFLVIAVVFGVLAAIVPAVRASRMKVLDAIATE